MRTIKRLSEQMVCEVEGACEYAKDALEHKMFRPQLAENYFKMAINELDHSETLHTFAQKLIKENEATKDIPQCMLDKWEKRHKEFIGKTAMVKIYLDMYR